MTRSLVWSVALSAVVAVAMTIMLNRSPSQRKQQGQRSVQVVVSLLGRAVTIGVSVDTAREDRSDSVRTIRPGIRAPIGQVP